jgi:hypothetical protein
MVFVVVIKESEETKVKEDDLFVRRKGRQAHIAGFLGKWKL